MNTVRFAAEEDIAALVAAEKACFPHDFWSREALLSHMASPVGRTLVLEKDGTLCAYLLATFIEPEGEILRIGTLPAFRRAGHAATLLSHFLEAVPCCFLEVRESNAAAKGLYEALGFAMTGKRPRYYQNPTEDACLYKKIL